MASPPKKIVYICDKKLIYECNRMPTMLNRASIVQDLVNSYGILSNEKFMVVKSVTATENELKLFHASNYIDFLKKVNDADDLEQFEEERLEYGLEYDCPILTKHYDLMRTLAGGSISAAKLLVTGKCKTAINWFGGWHHARRDAAEGFCYVNDVVLAIQVLSTNFNRILYLDLDIHHGDGVQYAFEYSDKILTMSFHKKYPGFYPGTGDIDEIGQLRGKYHSLNIPLLDGISHDSYLKLFHSNFDLVFRAYKPTCIVVQCGADGLYGDPVGQGNLTVQTIVECVRLILKCDLPTLFLGGGGYNFANTARLWTYLTSVIADIHIDEDIPDVSEYFTEYGPTYEIHIDPSLQKDQNTPDYINSVCKQIASYCSYLA